MIIVDYLSKSYHRFLQDVPQHVCHPKRFLITLNGPSSDELLALTEDLQRVSNKTVKTSTAIGDESAVTVISDLFSEASSSKQILLLDKADVVFTKTASRKKSNQQNTAFDLNNLLKNIANHQGMTILATENSQVLSASMSSRVDVLIRF